MEQKRPLTISAILKEFKLTQEEFCMLFSCRQPQVSRWLHGQVPTKLRAGQILSRYHHLKANPHFIALAKEELQKRKRAYAKSFSDSK
jgi:transcriptional regulator with XRE-family HTH domain